MTRNRLRLQALLATFFLVLALFSKADANPLDKTKNQFEVAARNACVKRELSTELGAASERMIIDDKCTCYARIFIDELFDDANFIEAQKSGKNDAKFQTAMREAVPDRRLAEISNFCTQKAVTSRDGSPKNLANEGSDLRQLNNEPGLQGVTREAFISSALPNCTAGDPSNEMKQFCSCVVNKTADKLSEQQVLSLLSGDRSKAAEAIFNLQVESAALCELGK